MWRKESEESITGREDPQAYTIYGDKYE